MSNDAKRWQDADRVFQGALEHEPRERAAFLDEACAGDDFLRDEVEALIESYGRGGDFIAEPLFKAAPELIAESKANSLVGGTIGPYKVKTLLGSGGMGEVYLAEDTRLGRKVALKLLAPELVAHSPARARFLREGRLAAALDHPNICSIYEVAEEADHSFIAMQYVEGETLASRIRRKPLELGESLDIAAQTADALSEAHSRDIIHRDIKPQNIMLTARGQAKVMDFGLAKVIKKRITTDSEAMTESLLTLPGTIMGTVPYMSPEQARGENLDARSDIFSFGAVLYEMVTGVQPFATESAANTMAAILTREPEPLARYSRRVPAELERIVSKSLRKDREERYQTVKDLIIDLKNLKNNLTFEAQLERAASPESFNRAGMKTASGRTVATASQAQVQSDNIAPAKTEPNGEHIVGETNRRVVGAAMVVAAVIAVAAISYYYFLAPNSDPAINSIAVLPFVNASGNADVEYLSDGMTESLINSLSQLPRLSVKAPSSVFRYKGKEVEPQEVAKALSVQAILSGHIVQRGGDLTLYLSLVDGRNGNQLWGEQYNRKLTDLVALQTMIARDVSQKLRARLSGADEQKLAKNYTANAEAYQLYLKGRYHLHKVTRSEIQTSISYFQQAVAIDPSYALAHIGLADGYRTLSLSGEMPSAEVLPRAKAAAQKAIAIDDTLAEAHALLGSIIFWYDWDWNAAEDQFKRALELDPKSGDAHWVYAHFLSNLGRHAEALAEIRLANEFDPVNLRNSALEGQFLIHAGHNDEALARLQKTFELDSNHYLAHQFASSAYIQKGKFAEAHKASELSPATTTPVALGAYALAKSGKRAEARAELEGILKLSTERYVSPYNIALIYNGLDMRDEALAWLERGYQQRHSRMTFLKVEPKWNNLRGDPRFQDLLRRIGFAT